MPIENIASKNPDGKWLYLHSQSNPSIAIAKVVDKLFLLKISCVPILFLRRLRGGKTYRLSKPFLQMRLRRIAIAFTHDSDKDKQLTIIFSLFVLIFLISQNIGRSRLSYGKQDYENTRRNRAYRAWRLRQIAY